MTTVTGAEGGAPRPGAAGSRPGEAAGARKEPSLRANFSWTFAGNLVYAATQWGMFVALAKLLSAEDVGRFTLGTAVSAPVLMFTNLQLRSVQSTDAREEFAFADYAGHRIVASFVAAAVVGVILWFTDYAPVVESVVLLVTAAKIIESLIDVLHGLQQRHERMDVISRSMIYRGLLSLAGLVAGTLLTGHVVGAVCGMTAAWVVVLAAFDVPALVRTAAERGLGGLAPRFVPRNLLRLTRTALPLGAVMSLISLNVNVPRYFVEAWAGDRELGLFSAMAYVLVAGTTVVGALGQSASPRLANLYAAGKVEDFVALKRKLSWLGVAVGAAALFVAAVGGRPLLSLVYTPEYAERLDVFVILMTAGAVSYVSTFTGYALTATRAFSAQVVPVVAATAATAASCVLLVPVTGTRGAAVSMVVSGAVSWFMMERALASVLRRG